MQQPPNDEWRDRGREVVVVNSLDNWPRRGVVGRTLVSSTGSPVYEVRFEETDFDIRLGSRDTLTFLDGRGPS